ncbi:hypothetical protein [Saccharothrix obliqua]|uniref:hypothetical protein n=1 Tax=Saccharothrix obliqua TaxID=2861747 RepID=UPI001C5D3B61|nr:hypothetical protein [Saccharothrix obliqua]MBW4718396.1 hypothetical protein [Saccharothrix obliqua]
MGGQVVDRITRHDEENSMEAQPKRYVPPMASKTGEVTRDTLGIRHRGHKDNGREGYRRRPY